MPKIVLIDIFLMGVVCGMSIVLSAWVFFELKKLNMTLSKTDNLAKTLNTVKTVKGAKNPFVVS